MTYKPSPLLPGQARRTLAHRLAKRVDRVRQIPTNFGIRADRVFLVWTRYDGAERGEGVETEVARLEILPTPRVSDQTTIQLSPSSAGILPIGSVRVDRISAQFTEDVLRGERVPDLARPAGAPITQPTDFFYEIITDDRSDLPADGCGEANAQMANLQGASVRPRSRFRIAAEPERRPGSVDFIVALERISEDRRYDGASRNGVVPVYEPT